MCVCVREKQRKERGKEKGSKKENGRMLPNRKSGEPRMLPNRKSRGPTTSMYVLIQEE